MFENFIMLFEKYQTFIVGIIGFAGVIFTIYTNARLSRNQHERQIKHDQLAIKTALYSELEVIRKIFEERCKMDNEVGGLGAAYYPEYVSNEIYLSVLDKIGLLSTEEIEVVLEAYLLIGDLPPRLKLISVVPDPSFDKPGHIYIDSEHAVVAIKLHKSFLPKIEFAIKMLKEKQV